MAFTLPVLSTLLCVPPPSRQRTPDKGPSPKTHHVSRFSMDDYPEELHKKVTLLQHFRKFLVSFKVPTLFIHDSHPVLILYHPSYTMSTTWSAYPHNFLRFSLSQLQGGGVKGSSVPSSASEKETAEPLEGDDASGPVYVRKWARTSLALVFRLSSRYKKGRMTCAGWLLELDRLYSSDLGCLSG